MALVQVFPRVGYFGTSSLDNTVLSAPKGPNGLWSLRTPQYRVIHIRSNRDTRNSDTLTSRLTCELIVFNTMIVSLTSVFELILNP
jgi:hypothetical protein